MEGSKILTGPGVGQLDMGGMSAAAIDVLHGGSLLVTPGPTAHDRLSPVTHSLPAGAMILVLPPEIADKIRAHVKPGAKR
jgi:hypothetical protein